MGIKIHEYTMVSERTEGENKNKIHEYHKVKLGRNIGMELKHSKILFELWVVVRVLISSRR